MHVFLILELKSIKKLQELNKKKYTNLFQEVFDKIFGNVTEPEIILTLDQILDKINDNGFESLTNTEKKQLEKYSNK